jgi:hypothetical protein
MKNIEEQKIDIKKKMVEVIYEIWVNGKKYPLHQRNIEVAKEYEKTKDVSVLEKLVSFSLEF